MCMALDKVSFKKKKKKGKELQCTDRINKQETLQSFYQPLKNENQQSQSVDFNFTST